MFKVASYSYLTFKNRGMGSSHTASHSNPLLILWMDHSTEVSGGGGRSGDVCVCVCEKREEGRESVRVRENESNQVCILPL